MNIIQSDPFLQLAIIVTFAFMLGIVVIAIYSFLSSPIKKRYFLVSYAATDGKLTISHIHFSWKGFPCHGEIMQSIRFQENVSTAVLTKKNFSIVAIYEFKDKRDYLNFISIK